MPIGVKAKVSDTVLLQQTNKTVAYPAAEGNRARVRCVVSLSANLCSIQCHLYTFAPTELLSKNWICVCLLQDIKKRTPRAELCDDARRVKAIAQHEDHVGMPEGRCDGSLHIGGWLQKITQRLLFQHQTQCPSLSYLVGHTHTSSYPHTL